MPRAVPITMGWAGLTRALVRVVRAPCPSPGERVRSAWERRTGAGRAPRS